MATRSQSATRKTTALDHRELAKRSIRIGSVVLLWEAGVVNRWQRDYQSVGPAGCYQQANDSKVKQTALRLIDLSSGFFVLAIGLGASLVCFAAELIVHYRQL